MQRDGSCAGPKWPQTLAGLTEKWRLPLGASYSVPVTNSGFIFTTGSKDKQFELAHAADKATGKPVWTAQWEGHQRVPFFAARNGDWIRATPALDGSSLHVSGMQDGDGRARPYRARTRSPARRCVPLRMVSASRGWRPVSIQWQTCAS
jgi:outer membrane protein assembly factor BamB